MRVDILSLFPEFFHGPLNVSILGRAISEGILDVRLVNVRDFATGPHKRVDDRPYGGGPGMVMMVDPLVKAIQSCRTERARVVYLSPQGRTLTASKARELAKEDHIIFLAGHYEGIDQRVIDLEVDEEISIGDYVLSNGCLAACVVLDAFARFMPGVLGHEDAAAEDSFEEGFAGLLDCPHYTRPRRYGDLEVPEVLLSGDHKKIQEWRRDKALEKTKRERADLYRRFEQSN